MLSEQTTSSLIGKRYELHDTIGHGGMGVVYRAIDRLTGQHVALKRVIGDDSPNFMDTADGGGSNFRLALAQEFKLLASIHHPYIIEVKDYGFDEEHQPYFTMELLDSPQTIIQAAADQPLQTQLTYIVQMLQALAYLHRRGILHRDLKPANVLVVNGQVKVLDFGLSMMRDRSHTETSAPQTAGTIAYMPPEILMGGAATEKSDLYAVGIIAYEILAGKYPFNDTSITNLIHDVMYTNPDYSLLDVDFDLALVIEELSQKDPDARHNNARDVILAMEAALRKPLVMDTTATRESFLQSARLVGRNTELDKLSVALSDAKNGTGSAWLIAGESGVGKSRILDELRTLSMVNGALVMRGQSVNEGRAPYHTWRVIFRWLGLLAELDPIDAGLIKLLVPDVVTLPESNVEAAAELESSKVQARMLRALNDMLKGQVQPVVIILEDLHWANSENLSLLEQLAKIAPQLPLLLVASYRDDERPDLPSVLPNIPLMKLNRLTDENIAELSEAMLGESGRHRGVVNLLQRETEGNVFFLVEVVRALAEEVGDLEQIGRRTLPNNVFAGGVQKIVQRRLSLIPLNYHAPLQYAAVIGRQQNLELLKHVLPDVNMDRFLAECANAAVLDMQDGVWRFAHDKLRDGVIEGIDRGQLRQIHKQVATAIETVFEPEDHAGALSYHWGIAADSEKEGYYAALAGEQSLRSGAYQQAVEYFERSLRALNVSTLPERESQMRRVYLQHRKAEAYLGFGGYTQARQLYLDSLTISEKLGDKASIAEALYNLGTVDYVRTLFDSAEKYYQDSLRIFQELDESSGIAKALNSLGNIAYEKGDDSAAKELYQRSLSLSRQMGGQWGMAGSLTTQENPSIMETNEYQDVRRTLVNQLTQHVQNNNKPGMAETYYNLGEISLQLNEFPDGTQSYRKSLAIYQEVNNYTGVVRCYERLGVLALNQKQTDEGMMWLQLALKTALEHDEEGAALGTLLHFVHQQVEAEHKEAALGLLAFILNHAELSAGLEDEAERITFELQDELLPGVAETSWERGKNRTFAEIVDELKA